MIVENNRVVAIHYVLKDDAGNVLHDNTNFAAEEYLHGAGNILPGLELALKEPDLLDVEVTIQRTQLADRAGVFEMALEASESVRAKNSIQRMQAHQLALAHKYAMDLMVDASKQRDPIIKVKLINCSARLMEAYSKGALALQRLQQGASQIVQVQHVQVHGQAVIGNVGGGQ